MLHELCVLEELFLIIIIITIIINVIITIIIIIIIIIIVQVVGLQLARKRLDYMTFLRGVELILRIIIG